MQMKLECPVVFFDLESTGTNVRRDRIVEFCFIKVLPDGSRENFTSRVNPQMLIPIESTEIHSITDADVADCPSFYDLASKVKTFISGCDLAGFNIVNFDIPLLDEEFKRVSVDFSFEGVKMLDAQKIFHKLEPRTLSAALKFYCGKEHDGAHGAEADVEATIDVLEAQIVKYDEVPDDAEGIAKFCTMTNPGCIEPSGRIRWKNGEACIGFGQKNGTLLRVMAQKEPGYLKWMINNNFSLEVKQICKDALKGKFPKKDK